MQRASTDYRDHQNLHNTVRFVTAHVKLLVAIEFSDCGRQPRKIRQERAQKINNIFHVKPLKILQY